MGLSSEGLRVDWLGRGGLLLPLVGCVYGCLNCSVLVCLVVVNVLDLLDLCLCKVLVVLYGCFVCCLGFLISG